MTQLEFALSAGGDKEFAEYLEGTPADQIKDDLTVLLSSGGAHPDTSALIDALKSISDDWIDGEEYRDKIDDLQRDYDYELKKAEEQEQSLNDIEYIVTDKIGCSSSDWTETVTKNANFYSHDELKSRYLELAKNINNIWMKI